MNRPKQHPLFWTVPFGLVLAGCATQPPAPLQDRAQNSSATVAGSQPATEAGTVAPKGFYRVKKGDTLYSIALDNGQDYRDIASWNRLENPNVIKVDQLLRVAPEDSAPAASGVVIQPLVLTSPVVEAKPLTAGVSPTTIPTTSIGDSEVNTATLKRAPRGGRVPYSEENLNRLMAGGKPLAVVSSAPAPDKTALKSPEKTSDKSSPVLVEKTSDKATDKIDKPSERIAEKPPEKNAENAVDGVVWSWPASGKVIAGFSEATNKGLNIAGKTGDPVLAAASGKIVYSGAGLRGYGKLVIIKHNETYLTAYAHNSTILVKEGQSVSKGQKIAEMGNTDADQVMLHFEVRKQGKPVDPARFLSGR